MESYYQLSIFLHVILELGLNSLITSYALLYIYHVVKQSQYGYDRDIYISMR